MDSYYYASGKKVALTRDDEMVAFDQASGASAGVAASASARRGPGGLVLAPRASLDERQIDSLRKAGALRSVFRRGEVVLVALPEVRVEFDDAKERRAAKALLAKKGNAVSVTQDEADLLVVRPSSGNADEALSLANQIYEGAHPAASSVRFVQFVSKPGTQR